MERQKELLESIIELLGKMMEHFEATDKLLEALVDRQREVEKNLDIIFNTPSQNMELDNAKG